MGGLILLLAYACVPGITWDAVPEDQGNNVRYLYEVGYTAFDMDADGTIDYEEVSWDGTMREVSHNSQRFHCPDPNEGSYYCFRAEEFGVFGSTSIECSKVLHIRWQCSGAVICENYTTCEVWEQRCHPGHECVLPNLECRDADA
jgi:hypothetical protein